MLQSVPSRASAKPRLLATFACPTFIVIQVIGVPTLFLAETEQQLMMTDDDGVHIDALQISQASGIVELWWNGPLYGAGSQAVGTVFKPYISIPNAQAGGLVTADQGAYGIEPMPNYDGGTL